MTTPNINTLLRAESVNSSRGAPMGASSRLEDPAQPLYVQRIKFVDGDYSADGTYWGGPPSIPLWCGFAGTDNRIYVRALSRAEAITEILEQFPEALFRMPAPL